MLEKTERAIKNGQFKNTGILSTQKTGLLLLPLGSRHQ